MPPKTSRKPTPAPRPFAADNPNTEQLMVRVPASLLEGLDAWVEKLNASGAGPRWTRSDVLRALLVRGVREKGAAGEAP